MLNEKEKRISKLESRLMPGPGSGAAMPREGRQARIKELAKKFIAGMPDTEYLNFMTEIDYLRKKEGKGRYKFNEEN